MKKSYYDLKADARNEAIEWQDNFANESYSWADLAEWSDYFTRKAKRYGLIREFRENGII